MEKFVVMLMLIALLAVAVFTYPVFSLENAQVYVVCESDYVADKVLKNSEKWQTRDYYVYKTDKNENFKARFIPRSRTVKEYILSKDNNIDMCNPFLQGISSGEKFVLGLPYVID